MKTITVKPTQGGKLISRGSAQEAGWANYVTKRDWRRELDQEIVREGHDWFAPSSELAKEAQAYPLRTLAGTVAPEAITLIHEAERGNGERVIIAGTPTRLFKYDPGYNGEYYYDAFPYDYHEDMKFGEDLIPSAGVAYPVTIATTPGKMYVWDIGSGEYQVTNGSTVQPVPPLYNPEFTYPVVNGQMQMIAEGTQIIIEGAEPTVTGRLREVTQAPYYQEFGNGTDLVVLEAEERIHSGRYFQRRMQCVFTAHTAYDPGYFLDISIVDSGGVTDEASVEITPDPLVGGDQCVVAISINLGFTTWATLEQALMTSPGGLGDQGWRVIASSYYTGGEASYYEKTGTGTPYYEDTKGFWQQIGSGFSADGSRWEACNINGYAIFNNGVDLPVTYHLADSEVKPIYELREQGVAYVGTIAAYGDVLHCADIGLINEDALEACLSHVSSGAVTASQPAPVNSGLITGTAGAGNGIVASANIFTAGMVGYTIEFSNGFSSTIEAYADPQNVLLADTPTLISGLNLPFFVINPDTDYTVSATGGIFLPTMVGLSIYWPDGSSRKITEYVSDTAVKVENFGSVGSDTFTIESTTAYARYTDSANLTRRQYRWLWGMNNEPRRFAAIYKGTILAGSDILTLDYPVRSLADGDEVLILGAGENGSNLTATITYFLPDKRRLRLDKVAQTDAEDTGIMLSDAPGSISAYEEVTGDSSAIVKMAELGGYFVIYKDASIVFARYTGMTTAPYQMTSRVETKKTLFYRNTLCTLVIKGTPIHFFAGQNAFYALNITNRTPEEIPTWELASNLFFEQATPANTNLTFSGINPLTKELWVCFPSASDDKAIAWDYIYDTLSTIGYQYTAIASVKRPVSGIAVGASDNWFLCGDSNGAVLRYGKSMVSETGWGGSKEIYHRLNGRYLATIRGGMFGVDYHDQSRFHEYVMHLSSQANPNTAGALVKFYSARNASETPTFMGTKNFTKPHAQNMVKLALLTHWFSDEIIVPVQNSPTRLSARTLTVSGVGSRSFSRHSAGGISTPVTGARTI
jgi:hypothetical protein